jgi:hypothetical protein
MRTLAAVALVALVCWPGCALADRLSGVSQARQIQAIGERCQATVLEIWDTGITVGNDPVVGLRVNVEPPDRPAYEARIEKSLVSRVHMPQVQPGSHVPVFVDPHNPGRVALGLYRY